MATEAPNYRPGNILDKEPTVIAAAIFAVVNFVVAAGSWTVDAETLAQGNTALVLVLTLFVRSKSTSNSTAQVLVEHAAASAEVQVKQEVGEFLMAAAVEKEQTESATAAAAPARKAKKAAKAARPPEH